MDFINIIGMMMALCLLIPRMSAAGNAKGTPKEQSRARKVFRVIAGIGWFSGLFLLSFNVGILELDRAGGNETLYVEFFWIWVAAVGALVILALVFSLVGAKRQKKRLLFAADLLPFPIFLLSALLLGHLLLLPASLLYIIGRIPSFFAEKPRSQPSLTK